MKRRSDITKLVTASREIWRQSINYQKVKRDCKNNTKKGWYDCKSCGQTREVIKIDHILPIGKQPTCMKDFGIWLEKLFCDPLNLQALCADCHSEKTIKDKQLLKPD